jgi:hypothetical protein
MRQFLPLTFLCFLLTSCTTYQYMTVSSNNIQQNDHKEFVVENDSIRLKYNFNGHNAPVNLEVQNKLGKPLYIDWKRSALIVNGHAISYAPGSLTLSGSTHTSVSAPLVGRRNWNDVSTSSSFKSTLDLPGDVQFIPPATLVNKEPMGVTNSFHYGKSESEFKHIKVDFATGYRGLVRQADFDDTNTPLRFTSYLTIYVEGDTEKPMILQHDFYISGIMFTNRAPYNFKFINDQEGNRFYVTQADITQRPQGYGILQGLPVLTLPASGKGLSIY